METTMNGTCQWCGLGDVDLRVGAGEIELCETCEACVDDHAHATEREGRFGLSHTTGRVRCAECDTIEDVSSLCYSVEEFAEEHGAWMCWDCAEPGQGARGLTGTIARRWTTERMNDARMLRALRAEAQAYRAARGE